MSMSMQSTMKDRLLRIPAMLSLRTALPSYHQLPSHDLSSSNGTPYSDASPFGSPLLTPTSRRGAKSRWNKALRRLSTKRVLAICGAIILITVLFVVGYKRRARHLADEAEKEKERNRPKFHWESYPR